jgi:putative endonuclease
MSYHIYILASYKRGTLYVGVTNDLARRVWEHKEAVVEGFTKEHDVKRLVYAEEFVDVREAITREKNIKAWKRDWKIELIEEDNSDWRDLYDELN